MEETPLLVPRDHNSTNNKRIRPYPRCYNYAVQTLIGFLVLASISAYLLSSNTSPQVQNFYTSLTGPQLKDNVSTEAVIQHLKHLESIAHSQPKFYGSRSTARGFNASAHYVVEFLRQHTDYKVWTQPLIVKEQVDDRLPSLTLRHTSSAMYDERQDTNENVNVATKVLDPRDAASLWGSGSADLKNVPLIHVSGCHPTTEFNVFTSFSEPMVALLPHFELDGIPREENCPDICARIVAAIEAGAKGIITYPRPYTEGYPRPLPPSGRMKKCTEDQFKIIGTVAAVTLGQKAGAEVLSWTLTGRTTVDLNTSTQRTDVTTLNVLAETPDGDEDNVVFVTAHLDSVPAGPGINDDGSGSMATLELAHAFYRTGLSKKTVMKVRFGWWAAEETGLQGSRYHVKDLQKNNPHALSQIKLNIDTDMIASPNYVRGIWDGRGLVHQPAYTQLIRPATAIQSLFESYFRQRDLPTVPFEFNGRSDFVAFMDVGIPAGGVITGEDEIKTVEQAEMFGGIAGMVLDPCYHQACDTVASLKGPGMVVLEQNLGALGYVMQKIAFEKDIQKFLYGDSHK